MNEAGRMKPFTQKYGKQVVVAALKKSLLHQAFTGEL